MQLSFSIQYLFNLVLDETPETRQQCCQVYPMHLGYLLLITVAFSFLMFYTYGVSAGVSAGALTSIVCACIDVATFYYNW